MEETQSQTMDRTVELADTHYVDDTIENTTPLVDATPRNANNPSDVDSDLNHIRLNLCTLFLHIQCCVR